MSDVMNLNPKCTVIYIMLNSSHYFVCQENMMQMSNLICQYHEEIFIEVNDYYCIFEFKK